MRVGPFVATFDAASDNRYRNYAIPDDGAAPTPADISTLIELFAGRSRIARLEYLDDLAPSVKPALLAAGFRAEGTLPLMRCSRETLQAPAASPGIELSLVTARSDLERAARVQNESYGEGETSEADVLRLENMIAREGAVVLAADTLTREPVGSGLYSAPLEGTTEIAAVGVRASHRRRGIGAALTAHLVHEALLHELDPFLMAAHEAEERMYERIGFETVATILHIALEPS